MQANAYRMVELAPSEVSRMSEDLLRTTRLA